MKARPAPAVVILVTEPNPKGRPAKKKPDLIISLHVWDGISNIEMYGLFS